MESKITCASVCERSSNNILEIPSGNKLVFVHGKNSESFLMALAGLFGGLPENCFRGTESYAVKADVVWCSGLTCSVGADFGNEERSFWVNGVEKDCRTSSEQVCKVVKAIHKHRFRKGNDNAHIFDGISKGVSLETSGESDRILKRFLVFMQETCRKTVLGDTRPIFLHSFLERLDEKADVEKILELTAAAERQVFIAVPHYYEIKALEEMPYDILVCSL